MPTFVLISAFIALGAFLYRLRGAPWLDFLHRPIKQSLYVSGWAQIAYMAGIDWQWYTLPVIAAIGTVSMGHGAYMDLGHTVKPRDIDERPVGWILQPLARILHIDQTTALYDSIGLTLNGMLMTLPFSILFWSTDHVTAGTIVLVAGASKTAAYWIGWSSLNKNPGTEVGEWLTGAFQYGGFVVAYFYM